MADDPCAVPLPGIAALPPATANQIGSGQVLVDPSSVVKELIDNALDARAKSIFVDITANTIDVIQVKDDGHGIPAEDRALVCRRYCTSKIRDFHDLRDVGGKWLGFRGEALASMAEMSGTFSITTRVEGEPVAVKLKYGRNGELSSTERESHPVGTTVKVNSFFEHIPVRKQTAVKSSAKWLARIRHLMQSYALARPAVRFRLHILKAKNTKGDFVYAPKANSNIEDAVLKVIGKDCALQCDWTAFEKDGFEVHAFLPKPTATGAKIANQGAFISVDSRPVSSSRGTMKQIAATFRGRLSESNVSLGSVRDPFFCINIFCPPDSYDPNIEPAKDDVMFENESLVVSIVEEMLKAFYPEAILGELDIESPTSAQHDQDAQYDETTRDHTPLSIYEDAREIQSNDTLVESQRKEPRWRSSMYGIDEDDLEFLQANQPPLFEEEEGLREASISNPWTIARMNAAIKPKRFVDNRQLLSPAKSQGSGFPGSSSPVRAKPALVSLSSDSLIPQTSSRNLPRSTLDKELEQSIQPFTSAPSSEQDTMGTRADTAAFNRQPNMLSIEPEETRISLPRRQQQKQPDYTNKPFVPPVRGSSDTWFGQPMRGSQSLNPPRSQKRSKQQEIPLFPSDNSSNLQRLNPTGVETIEYGLHSKTNTDIRSFFGGNRRPQNSHVDVPVLRSSFTPINRRVHHADEQGRSNSPTIQREGSFDGDYRATSAEPYPRSNHARGHPMESSNQDRNTESVDMAAEFLAYAARSSPRPSSIGSTTPTQFHSRQDEIRSPLPQHTLNDARLKLHNASQQSQASKDDGSQPLSPPSFLKEHQNLSTTQSKDVRHNGSRLTTANSKSSKSRRLRRRTTDALERTKSSKLPLERVPYDYRIQDIIIPIATNLPSIVQVSHKLDMRRNSPDWGYPVDDAYDVFVEHVAERTIMDWVIRLDGFLQERYERVDGVETRGVLHEGIQGALDERKEQDSGVKSVEVISVRDDKNDGRTVGEVDESITKSGAAAHSDIDDDSPRSDGQQAFTNTKPNVIEEDMSDFDMAQVVDVDSNKTTTVAQSDEYDGDIDDMLMGL